ncbi:MAG: YabP/YqfC family sporulation protein [Clostridia bacterium]
MDIKSLALYTEIFSNKRLTVQGCQGIIDYNNEEITIKTGQLKMTIKGKNLKIHVFTDTNADIEGYISSINFEH